TIGVLVPFGMIPVPLLDKGAISLLNRVAHSEVVVDDGRNQQAKHYPGAQQQQRADAAATAQHNHQEAHRKPEQDVQDGGDGIGQQSLAQWQPDDQHRQRQQDKQERQHNNQPYA